MPSAQGTCTEEILQESRTTRSDIELDGEIGAVLFDRRES